MTATNGERTPAALRRFGLGARPGDLKTIGSDPKAAILAELETRKAPLRPTDTIVSVDKLFAAWRAHDLRPYQMWELQSRLDSAQDPLVGFNERLVWFWNNHLTVSAGKNHLLGYLVGAYERQAIRPHVFGRFEDLLAASAKHPAMLAYLDNAKSAGPESATGKAKSAGLNENYAREVMELHTLGADGGYGQGDVTNLARILTGWSYAEPADAGLEPKLAQGDFLFRTDWHEPGAIALLGQTYAQTGVAQGEAALRALARRPATARSVSRKLARAFVSDTPPPALTARLEQTYLKTDGDLMSVYRAMLDSPEAWRDFGAKVRAPMEVMCACIRATGVHVESSQAYDILGGMGQAPWVAPSPQGYSDSVADQTTPIAVKGRVDVAATLAKLAKPEVKGVDVARETLGDLAPLGLLDALAKADAQGFGLALLFASPEFQRR